MIEVRRECTAAPRTVWAVLADPGTFPAWVVGAARVDRVDVGWPAVGAAMDYRVGAWPALLPARSSVRGSEPERLLALHGDLGPLGAVDVVVSVAEAGPGSVLTIREDVAAGPATFVPRPLRATVIRARNVETLRRLALLAEGAAA